MEIDLGFRIVLMKLVWTWNRVGVGFGIVFVFWDRVGVGFGCVCVSLYLLGHHVMITQVL